MRTLDWMFMVCFLAQAIIGMPASGVEVSKNPLQGLPSKPGAHLEKIKLLGDNEWVCLGEPEADPQWGQARGRSWGGKAFAFAPELRGAFFTGEGEHAMVKPDGFGMDDYWVYDINANRWICIFPGTDTKNFSQSVKNKDLKVSETGLVVDKEGHPVPGHLLIHAWGLLAYDTDRKQFAFIANDNFGRYYMPGTGGTNPVDEGLKLIEEQRKNAKKTPQSPWFYDSATGKFERYVTNPKPGQGAFPSLLYMTRSRQYFLVGAKGVVFYDPDKKTWAAMKPQGPAPKGYDFGACYDPKRDRVYMGGTGALGRKPEENFLIYDVKTNTWTKPEPKGTYPAVFSTNYASIHYDTANDAVVILQYNEKKIYVYNPDTNTWAEPLHMHDLGRACCNAFYDPELNVHFVFVAGDSRDKGVMWAYRYKNVAAKKCE